MRKGIAITKSVFKRSLYACIIALMLTGVAPSIPGYNAVLTAEAAAKPALSKTKVSVVKGKTYRLIIKNIKKGTKVKWSTSKKSTATVKASKDGLSCVVTGRCILRR